jgi:hypothetical protein
MALSLDEFRAESKRGPRCTFGRLLERLDKNERAVLEAAMADPDVQHKRIADVLKAAGHKMEAHTVSRHRNCECQC